MATLPPGARVLVGHDARRNSAVFAADVADMVVSSGGVALTIGQSPTPVASHAVVELSADAGVVITASHNPPGDNGYKLYSSDGAQIIPPADAAVEGRMAVMPTAMPTAGSQVGENGLMSGGLGESGLMGSVECVGDAAVESYVDSVCRSLTGDNVGVRHNCPLRVVYTPLHGVGAPVLLRLFERLGLPEPLLVPSQAEPDPLFPTVAFPNPEEPGTLEAALSFAEEVDADLVLANDPDADRLAVAVPLEVADDQPDVRRWRALTGDELGVLLADCLLRRLSNRLPPFDDGTPSATDQATTADSFGWLLAASVVSSRMLASVARAAGVAYAETLTGFKWIARAADGRPARLLFGYEEALGYAVCDAVRDKDGLSAAALFVQLFLSLRTQGLSPLDRLDCLALLHGVHATGQVSVRFDAEPTAAVAATAWLREIPPSSIAGQDVNSLVDYSVGGKGGSGSLMPPSNMLAFHLRNGDRVIVRPSGTEPKLKVYIEAVEHVGADGLPQARLIAGRRLGLLKEAMRRLVQTAWLKDWEKSLRCP